MSKVKMHKGTNDFIYDTIGRFAMSQKVITEFKGYPITTSENHVWFLSFSNSNELEGFCAIKINKGSAVFTNDYTLKEHRKKGVHTELLKKRIAYCKQNGVDKITATCSKPCVRQYLKQGFEVIKTFTNFTKVELKP